MAKFEDVRHVRSILALAESKPEAECQLLRVENVTHTGSTVSYALLIDNGNAPTIDLPTALGNLMWRFWPKNKVAVTLQQARNFIVRAGEVQRALNGIMMMWDLDVTATHLDITIQNMMDTLAWHNGG